MLQWGRVLKDAEMPVSHGHGPKSKIASMGPRLEGRGNAADANMLARLELLQWGRVLKDAEIGRLLIAQGICCHVASMGPRLEGRGNGSTMRTTTA